MLKRNIKVTFRMNRAEHQALQKRVKKSGYSQEGYIRTVLGGSVPREPPNADFHGMMRELNAIGNRMNQIAARANATGFFLAEDYASNYAMLMEKVLAIQAAVTLPEKTA